MAAASWVEFCRLRDGNITIRACIYITSGAKSERLDLSHACRERFTKKRFWVFVFHVFGVDRSTVDAIIALLYRKKLLSSTGSFKMCYRSLYFQIINLFVFVNFLYIRIPPFTRQIFGLFT